MEKVFNKLVRDNIPEIITNNGEVAITRILDDEEYNVELMKKLSEECNEVLSATTKEDTLEELSDVYEILKAIAYANGSNIEEVIKLANAKAVKRGAFDKKIYLISTKK